MHNSYVSRAASSEKGQTPVLRILPAARRHLRHLRALLLPGRPGERSRPLPDSVSVDPSQALVSAAPTPHSISASSTPSFGSRVLSAPEPCPAGRAHRDLSIHSPRGTRGSFQLGTSMSEATKVIPIQVFLCL